MGQRFTRRRFGAAAIATASAAVAGCLSDDDDEFGSDEQAVDLIINLQDENDDPVSQGVQVIVEDEEGDFRSTYQHEIAEGQIRATNLGDPGEYTVTVESTDEEFDTVEETHELEAAEEDDGDEDEEDDAEEITITLDGATSDVEREEAEEENGDE